MNAVRKELEELAGKELEAANRTHKPFASLHEAWAVLEEELQETEGACEETREYMLLLWRMVREQEDLKEEIFDRLKVAALDTAAEAVQVAAMADKAAVLLKKADVVANTPEPAKPEVRKGLLLYRCPVCGSVFYRADPETLEGMVVSCNCGAVKTIDAGQLAAFEYKCGSCDAKRRGWTNVFEAEVTVRCKCRNLITLRWNKKAKRYTEGGL